MAASWRGVAEQEGQAQLVPVVSDPAEVESGAADLIAEPSGLVHVPRREPKRLVHSRLPQQSPVEPHWPPMDRHGRHRPDTQDRPMQHWGPTLVPSWDVVHGDVMDTHAGWDPLLPDGVGSGDVEKGWVSAVMGCCWKVGTAWFVEL